MQITVATANVMKIPIILSFNFVILIFLLLSFLTLCEGSRVVFYLEVSPIELATIRTTTESVIINCNIIFLPF